MPNRGNRESQAIGNIQRKRGSKPVRACRLIAYFVLGLLLLIFSTSIAGILWLKKGIDSPFIAAKIESALRAKLGDVATLNLEQTNFFLDETHRLMVEATDMRLALESGGVHIDKIGKIRAALDIWPLLTGTLHIKQISMSDVVVTLPSGRGGNFLEKLPQDSLGRIDFDATSNLVFDHLNVMLSLLVTRGLDMLTIDSMSVHFYLAGEEKTLQLDRLHLANQKNQVTLAGLIQWQGMQSQLIGKLTHSGANALNDFAFSLNDFPLHLGADDLAQPLREDGRINNNFFRAKGQTHIKIEGKKAPVQTVSLSQSEKQHEKSTLSVALKLPQARLDLGTYQNIDTSLQFYASHQYGSGKINIDSNSLLQIGALTLPFEGSFAPMPLSKGMSLEADNPDLIANLFKKYHFNLETIEANATPAESPEQKLLFSAQMTGFYQDGQNGLKNLGIEALTLSTQNGSLINGKGRVHIGQGSPAVNLSLKSAQIAAGEVKQLWPITLTPSTRRWILTHITSGHLRQVRLDINLPQGFYQNGLPAHDLTKKELHITADLDKVDTHLINDLPPLQQVNGRLNVSGAIATIEAEQGQLELDGDILTLQDGRLTITRRAGQPALLASHFTLSGGAKPAAQLISLPPIKAHEKLPLSPQEMEGYVTAQVDLHFPLSKKIVAKQINWHVDANFSDFSSPSPVDPEVTITQAQGQIEIDNHNFSTKITALLNAIPAKVLLSGKTNDTSALETEKITLFIDDTLRERLTPALKPFISGPMEIDVGPKIDGERTLQADLTNAALHVPWLDWKKKVGVPAHLAFSLKKAENDKQETHVNNFLLQGKSFKLAGTMLLQEGTLQLANFSHANLERQDNMQLTIRKLGNTYQIDAKGKRFDARKLIKNLNNLTSQADSNTRALTLNVAIKQAHGFYDAVLTNLKFHLKRNHQGNQTTSLAATTNHGAIEAQFDRQGKEATLRLTGADAGTLLRFMDYYDKIHGGKLEMQWYKDANGTLSGPLLLHDFFVIDEPKLAHIVSNAPVKGQKSLNDVLKKKVNASRLHFDRAFAQVTKGDNFLILDDAIVSGTTAGATFQGIVYDGVGDIAMTGTFMPAYGLNRLFGDVPIIGAILGNGRDNGLIGITFKVDGKAKEPKITLNPLSAIAPGILRQIFEFQQ